MNSLLSTMFGQNAGGSDHEAHGHSDFENNSDMEGNETGENRMVARAMPRQERDNITYQPIPLQKWKEKVEQRKMEDDEAKVNTPGYRCPVCEVMDTSAGTRIPELLQELVDLEERSRKHADDLIRYETIARKFNRAFYDNRHMVTDNKIVIKPWSMQAVRHHMEKCDTSRPEVELDMDIQKMNDVIEALMKGGVMEQRLINGAYTNDQPNYKAISTLMRIFAQKKAHVLASAAVSMERNLNGGVKKKSLKSSQKAGGKVNTTVAIKKATSIV